jgi:hypothetical protein
LLLVPSPRASLAERVRCSRASSAQCLRRWFSRRSLGAGTEDKGVQPGKRRIQAKHTNPNSFSNHSWGSALDLFSDEQPIESSHLGVHAGASGNQLVVGHQSLSDKKLKNIPDPVRIHRLLPRPEPYPRSNFRGTPRWRDLKPLIEERAANRLHGPASGSSRCREWKRCGGLVVRRGTRLVGNDPDVAETLGSLVYLRLGLTSAFRAARHMGGLNARRSICRLAFACSDRCTSSASFVRAPNGPSGRSRHIADTAMGRRSWQRSSE